MMPITLTCRHCGNSFRSPPCQAAGRVYCSHRCKGDAQTLVRRRPLTDRLAERMQRGEADECWPWHGERMKSGYGMLRPPGQRSPVTLTHRAAYALAHGPIPAGMQVVHTCDNPPCCNPAHLRLGDQRANTIDRDSKGRVASGDRSGRRTHPERYPSGDTHPKAKVTTADAEIIRQRVADGERRSKIAADYDVDSSVISRIMTRSRRWARS